jgi:branched-chain amino acid transport system ATP-binding protein
MLTVSNLRFNLGRSTILNGVDIAVRAGEKLGIIGPNGSGKTTLFNCINGFNIPSGGTITFKGQDVTSRPAHEKAALGLGRVFQTFGVFKEMTVLENIVTALESKQGRIILPWSSTNRRNTHRAMEYLAMVGLDIRAREKAGSLSGGQMRLLEIIRALATEADLLLLDEPTAGVSPKMKHEVEGLLRRLQEMNKTVLIIEHDLNFIQALCERIVVLDVGKVVLDGTPEYVRSHKLLQEIYFGNSNNGAEKHAA